METWGQKTPTENNNPEEKPEDVEHSNPQTPNPIENHKQYNLLSRPPKYPPSPKPTHKTHILPVIDH